MWIRVSGDCTEKNIVYELSCNVCQAQGQQLRYIGETKRPARLQFNEHVRDAVNKAPDTPMGDHFGVSHPTINVSWNTLKIRILYRSQDHPDSKIAESLLIQKNHPLLHNISPWPIL